MLETFLNGDIRLDAIDHFPAANICDEDIQKAFLKDVPKVLLSSMLPLFPRHRWVGAEAVIKMCGLLFVTHSLGQALLPAWAAELSTKPKRSPAKGQAYASGENLRAAPRARVPNDTAQPGNDWAAFNERVRCDAATWAAEENPPGLLVIRAAVCEPVAAFHALLLALGSRGVEAQNDLAVSSGL